MPRVGQSATAHARQPARSHACPGMVVGAAVSRARSRSLPRARGLLKTAPAGAPRRWSGAPQFAELDREACLVHGDFNKRNLLVRRAGGRWTVAVHEAGFAIELG